jgi:translocation protein SEC63
LLDYDDSAFYYFAVSVLSVIMLPLTYSIIKTVIKGENKLDLSNKNCECASCQDLIRKRQAVLAKSWKRPGFFFKVTITVVLWVVFLLLADHLSKIEPLKSFDPFQILGVEADADMQTIKKAYRKLSLLKHPDRNPDDPLAATEFIQITKAYTALTDETAKENY